MELANEEATLKRLVKEALVEILEERPELISEAIVDALEDVAMLKAIQEGENSASVPKERIARLLDRES